jgi:small subunit ribosomal protein S6
LRTYEVVLVVQPGLDEEGLDAFIGNLTGVVTEAGGQVVDVEHMGRRRLAYPIKKVTEAHYVLLHLNMENAALVETERRIKLSEDVLRHLVIRMDELMEPAPAQEIVAPQAANEAVVEAADDEAVDGDELVAELADELAEDEPEA